MRKLILLTVGTFGIAYGYVASATDYPLCSKTVRDECMNPSEAHGKAMPAMHKHHAHHKVAEKHK